MKTLITGAGGFVGSWLQATLCLHDDVTLVEKKWGSDALDFFRTDDTKYDRVFHCAALVGGRATIDGTPMDVATNLALDSWYFKWIERTRPDQAVYFSSSAAYPVDLQTEYMTTLLHESDIDLSAPGTPDNTYGLAKVVGEQLAQRMREQGHKIYVFRPFSGYAANQSLDYPFPSFIDRAHRQLDPFHVWGTGTQVRDWIHVSDIMGAIKVALDEDIQGPVNLCTGRATYFLELAAIAARAAGYNPKIEPLASKPTGVHYRVGDPTMLHEFYTPQVTIEQGVAVALAQLAPKHEDVES